MPTYEYACTSCKNRIEVVQSFRDPPLDTCDLCGSPLKRVFHPVGIVLKGGGFYSTDNRPSAKKAFKEPAKASSDSSGGSDKTSSDGASTKPASAPEKSAPKKKASGGAGS